MEEKTPDQNSITPPVSSPSTFSEQEKPTPFYKRKKYLTILIILLVAIGITGSLYYFATSQKQVVIENPQQKSKKPSSVKTQKAPSFTAQKYLYNDTPPAVKNMNTYKLRPATKSDAVSLARKLNLNSTPIETGQTISFSDIENKNTRGALVFNTSSGAFAFKSYGEIKTQGSSSVSRAVNLISALELTDNTTECEITYKNVQNTNITFVECHKSWEKLGAPLVNLGGILNLPEDTKISSLAPGEVITEDAPLDKAIIDVSNGGNGYARPNDFNTITVGLYPDGTLYSLESSARVIQQSQPFTPDNLLTPAQAIEIFRKNKAQFSLTLPTGEGNLDFNKVYRENTAQAINANVSEMLLVYLDKPMTETQNSYTPTYLIHGTSVLESGYTVQFVATIPALKSEYDDVLEITSDSTIQLGTFQLPTSTETQIAKTISPIITQPPYNPVGFCTDVAGENVVLVVPGYGSLTYLLSGSSHKHTYFAIQNVFEGGGSSQQPDLTSGLFKAIEEQYLIFQARHMRDDPTSFPKGMTPNDVYKKFDEIQKGITTNIKDVCSTTNGTIPLFTSANSLPCDGGTYNSQKAREIAVNNSTPLSAALNNGSIEEIASRPDIFPPQTLTSFHWILGSPPGNYLAELERVVPGFYLSEGGSVRARACIVSGASPVIFIYSKNPQNINIFSNAVITYSDPAVINNNTWSGIIKNDVFTNTKGISRQSIYYEYDPTKVLFNESSQGYIIEKEKITQQVADIADKLELNVNETKALQSDVQNALIDLGNTEFIKISLINVKEINEQLPLAILPKPPSIKRIHLMLSKAKSIQEIEKPVIKKIKRSDYSVLELGVYAK